MAYCIWKSQRLKISPWLIFESLQGERNCFFLDSSLYSRHCGRYSLLGAEPFFIFKGQDPSTFRKLKEALNNYNLSCVNHGIPFLGGAVGYFSYDLGLALEKSVKAAKKPETGIPGCLFGFYNAAIIVDHLKARLHIFAVGFPEKSGCLSRLLAQENFKKINLWLSKIDSRKRPLDNLHPKALKNTDLNSNFTKAGYIAAINKAKDYIKNGDIYQVNLSQQFTTDSNLPACEIYKRLRRLSPSCFSAYFDAGDFQILSSSPEGFLRLEGSTVTTRPMKGTRSRGKNKRQDAALKKELLKSVKDKAELLMIVDLERNDLGRVCAYNSIRVPKLRQLEEYSTVFQTTATISGCLHQDKDRIDLLRACFPGGSITGCPKIRAMEIIEELEPNRRAIYTGSLGYLSFSGSMDFNILIRTILKKGRRLCFGVGGGIVTDSDPCAEYAETLVKAQAMAQAIR